MSSTRSSVRPKSSKQPWGTILKPEFGMGHQKATASEVDDTVDRLHQIPQKKEPEYVRPKKVELDGKGIDDMVSLS